MEITYYTTNAGRSPFQKWCSDLDASVKPKVDAALEQLKQQSFYSDADLPNGITHLKHPNKNEKYREVDIYETHVAGKYRIYFGIVEDKIVIIDVNEKHNKHGQQIDIMFAYKKLFEYQQKAQGLADGSNFPPY